ncbi:MAG: adenosylcobinamide-GDP ribazoletransferase [Rubricoccaceae bacterium]
MSREPSAHDLPVPPGAPRGPLGDALRVFLTAVMFLTRLPVPRWVGHDAPTLSRASPYFPAVGVLVGLFGAAFYGLVGLAFPPWLAAAAALAATVWLTGAFHEDALGDTFDGLGGGWTREEVLRIMRDSRMGTYGTVALVLTLGARWGALATIGAAGGPAGVAAALVAAHALGRWTALPLILWLPYVREHGTGKPFAASVTPARLAAGSALAGGAAALALGGAAVPAIATVLGVTLVAGAYFRARLGGMTGDCLGAANQLAELAVYLVLLGDWAGAAARLTALAP